MCSMGLLIPPPCHVPPNISFPAPSPLALPASSIIGLWESPDRSLYPICRNCAAHAVVFEQFLHNLQAGRLADEVTLPDFKIATLLVSSSAPITSQPISVNPSAVGRRTCPSPRTLKTGFVSFSMISLLLLPRDLPQPAGKGTRLKLPCRPIQL